MDVAGRVRGRAAGRVAAAARVLRHRSRRQERRVQQHPAVAGDDLPVRPQQGPGDDDVGVGARRPRPGQAEPQHRRPPGPNAGPPYGDAPSPGPGDPDFAPRPPAGRGSSTRSTPRPAGDAREVRDVGRQLGRAGGVGPGPGVVFDQRDQRLVRDRAGGQFRRAFLFDQRLDGAPRVRRPPPAARTAGRWSGPPTRARRGPAAPAPAAAAQSSAAGFTGSGTPATRPAAGRRPERVDRPRRPDQREPPHAAGVGGPERRVRVRGPQPAAPRRQQAGRQGQKRQVRRQFLAGGGHREAFRRRPPGGDERADRRGRHARRVAEGPRFPARRRRPRASSPAASTRPPFRETATPAAATAARTASSSPGPPATADHAAASQSRYAGELARAGPSGYPCRRQRSRRSRRTPRSQNVTGSPRNAPSGVFAKDQPGAVVRHAGDVEIDPGGQQDARPVRPVGDRRDRDDVPRQVDGEPRPRRPPSGAPSSAPAPQGPRRRQHRPGGDDQREEPLFREQPASPACRTPPPPRPPGRRRPPASRPAITPSGAGERGVGVVPGPERPAGGGDRPGVFGEVGGVGVGGESPYGECRRGRRGLKKKPRTSRGRPPAAAVRRTACERSRTRPRLRRNREPGARRTSVRRRRNGCFRCRRR